MSVTPRYLDFFSWQGVNPVVIDDWDETGDPLQLAVTDVKFVNPSGKTWRSGEAVEGSILMSHPSRRLWRSCCGFEER
jgi:hypothetical protein